MKNSIYLAVVLRKVYLHSVNAFPRVLSAGYSGLATFGTYAYFVMTTAGYVGDQLMRYSQSIDQSTVHDLSTGVVVESIVIHKRFVC